MGEMGRDSGEVWVDIKTGAVVGDTVAEETVAEDIVVETVAEDTVVETAEDTVVETAEDTAVRTAEDTAVRTAEDTAVEEEPESVPAFDFVAFSQQVFAELEAVKGALAFEEILAELAVVKNSLNSSQGAASDSDPKDQIISDLHDELMQHRRNFKQEIILPLLKGILRVSDRLLALENVYRKKFEEMENVPAEVCDLLNELGSARDSIVIMLQDFDILEVVPECGSVFSAKECQCVEVRPAESEEVKNTIAAVIKSGFKNDVTGRIVEYPQVAIYK